MAKQVQIGDRVADRITGFVGIVTGRTEYINGCRQFLVRHEKLSKEGSIQDGLWIDEQNLAVKDAQVLSEPFPVLRHAAAAGGPERTHRSRQ